MDFQFTEEQEMLRDSIRKYLKKECTKEYCREIDEAKRYPREVFAKMGELGWLALPFPEEYGGYGGTIIDQFLITEELSRASVTIGLVYFMSVCFGGKSIEYFGSEEQKKYYLPQLFSGKSLFAIALTEPGGGTDVLGALKTKAEKQGDHFVVNGTKMFITAAHVSKYLVTLVKSDPSAKKASEGTSVLIIEADSPGIQINPLDSLGIRATGTNEVVFDNVKVPVENVLGDEGKGWYYLTDTLNNERVLAAALSVGAAQAAFDDALQYAKERTAFGKPIGGFQAIQHYLAEMATKIEMARLISYYASWMQTVDKKKADVISAMAKYGAAEAGIEVTQRGMRILGGYGYMMEFPMQRYYRDAWLLAFGPISQEMSKNYIAMSFGLPRSF
ncbi:MAG: acyl-CoA/acyl-ACP dehydrogenase [Deltaproteobacteria bacterium]|nr:acyl-CoA/acyl-ACP dehydrogenase [Deltaproteobacteria bacterium]